MEQNSAVDKLTISIPRNTMTDLALANLKALVRNKENLIKKALGADSLEIVVDEDKISFPWFRADVEDGVNIYASFISGLCEVSRKLTRVNSKEEKPVENEKYAFRCFLLRLGFVGNAYKKQRKVLLQNLEGSTAFKNVVNPEEEKA